MDIFFEAGCHFDERTIERAHRLGPYNPKQKFPRPIIMKFNHYMDREEAWRAMSKDPRSMLFVRDDLPAEIDEARRKLLPIFHEARKNPANKARLKLDKLYIRGKDFTVKTLNTLPQPLQPKRVFTPSIDNEVAFYSSESPLSYFHPSPFIIGSQTYTCVEQYIQQQKSLMFGDHSTASEIMKAATPLKQKQLSYKIEKFNRQVWEERACEATKPGLKAKYEQNEACRTFLLQTADKEIIEASPNDKFWGIGRGLRDPHVWDKSKRQGSNNMGKLLMEVRDLLKG